jgi:hypothetical protein
MEALGNLWKKLQVCFKEHSKASDARLGKMYKGIREGIGEIGGRCKMQMGC